MGIPSCARQRRLSGSSAKSAGTCQSSEARSRTELDVLDGQARFLWLFVDYSESYRGGRLSYGRLVRAQVER